MCWTNKTLNNVQSVRSFKSMPSNSLLVRMQTCLAKWEETTLWTVYLSGMGFRPSSSSLVCVWNWLQRAHSSQTQQCVQAHTKYLIAGIAICLSETAIAGTERDSFLPFLLLYLSAKCNVYSYVLGTVLNEGRGNLVASFPLSYVEEEGNFAILILSIPRFIFRPSLVARSLLAIIRHHFRMRRR